MQHIFSKEIILSGFRKTIYIFHRLVALKVKSDFNAIIDKSKLIANALMQNVGGQDIDYYSKLIFNNDRDFLFFGLASVSKDGKKLIFFKTVYNTSLMSASQITTERC